MKIARLCIENLRGIERLEVDLTAPDGQPRRRLVLLGGNGTGKTTTLAAIAHVFGRENRDFGAERLGAGDIRQVGRPLAAPDAEPPRGRIALDVVLSTEERGTLLAELGSHSPSDLPLLGLVMETPLIETDISRAVKMRDFMESYPQRFWGGRV